MIDCKWWHFISKIRTWNWVETCVGQKELYGRLCLSSLLQMVELLGSHYTFIQVIYYNYICAALQTARFFSLVLFLFWWGTRTVLKVRKLTSHDSTKLWYWQDSCLFTVNKPFISRSENSKHYNNSTSLLSPIYSI